MKLRPKLDSAYKSLVIITIILLAVLLAGNLVMTIVFSGLLAIILAPLSEFLEKFKIPRGLASLLTVLITSLFFIGLFFILIIQSQEIVKEVPALIENREKIIDFQSIEIQSQTILDYIEEHITTIEESINEFKDTFINIFKKSIIGIRDTIIFLILCPIYVFFMLLCRDHIFRFIIAFHIEENGSDASGMKLIKEIKSSLFHYLKGLTLVMFISGTLTFIGLYILGINYALFLGVLTAILTPIPYIGVFISALIPIILAILTKDSLWYAGGVLIVFAVVQFLEAYVVTPKVMGNSININPLMIVLALVVFGSLTGVLGMILTVPLLAISKVIIDHYTHLTPWKRLLEDKYIKNDH